MRISILFFTLLFFSTFSVAQNFTGYIHDYNNKPINRALIVVKDKNIATITNSDGKFSFYNLTNEDVLQITHISYVPKQIDIHTLRDSIIKLQKRIYTVAEVAVSAHSAAQIVDKAIDNIGRNYYKKNNIVKGFIREELYHKDSLQAVTEAQLLTNYPKNKSKNAKISVLNKQTLFSKHENQNYFVINSPLALMSMDEVLNQKTILNKTIKKHHIFSFEDIYTDTAGVTIHKISFRPKKKYHAKKSFTGVLYIRNDDYAITHLQIQNYRTKLIIDYKPINDIYVSSNMSIDKQQIVKGDTLNGKINYVFTNFLSKKKDAKRFYENEALQKYQNTYNSDFWKEKISILPDSALNKQIEALKKEQLEQKKLQKTYKEKKKIKIVEPFYKPTIAFGISTQSFNDVDLLSYNILKISQLTNYTIASQLRNKNISSLMQVVYSVFLSMPFQAAEAERRILNYKGYPASEMPFAVNGFFSSYAKNMSNDELSELKTNSTADFLRLHTIRYETNLNTIKRIEEELFRYDFLKGKHKNEFLEVYFVDYFVRRLFLSSQFLLSSIEKSYPEKDELKMPFSTNRINSYVKYLHNPQYGFNRDIAKSDLTDKEQSYARQIRLLSLINFIPAITNLLPAIQIAKSYDLRISGSYIPIVFGHQFEQNLYLRNQNKLTVFNFRQFLNHSNSGFGIGIKLIDRKLFANITSSTQIDYWKQPETLSFYDTKLNDGFAIKQIFNWQAKKWGLWIGYTLKTDGFIDYATSLRKGSNIQAGALFVL